MKIILLKDLKKVGKMYETKEVKDGYAVNFLIPKKFAKVVNDSNMKWLDRQKVGLEKKIQENEKIAQDLVTRLENIQLTIYLKSDKEGNIFESVRVPMILKELKKQGIELDKQNINLEEKIKSIGDFEVPIDFGSIVAKLKIKTVTENEEQEG